MTLPTLSFPPSDGLPGSAGAGSAGAPARPTGRSSGEVVSATGVVPGTAAGSLRE
jgi:hypothetical protein